MSSSAGVFRCSRKVSSGDAETGPANVRDRPSCNTVSPPPLPNGETGDYALTPPDAELHQHISLLTLQAVKDRAAPVSSHFLSTDMWVFYDLFLTELL